MKKYFNQFKEFSSTFIRSIKPGPVAWRGANRAIGFTGIVIWLIASLIMFVIQPNTIFGVGMILIGLLLAFLTGAGAIGIKWIVSHLNRGFLWVVPGTILLMTTVFSAGSLSWQFPLLVILFSGATGAGISVLFKKNRLELTLRHKIVAASGCLIGVAGLIWGIIWLADTGFEPEIDHINAATKSDYQATTIKLPDPSLPGQFEVAFLTYGSGTDKHRQEFAEGISIKTDSVDGSRLLDNWSGISGKLRTWYWGFDEKALPLNGRVWYPVGEGPFPIALIVHGNHSMFDFSDSGYAYLGELLASQGIIMVSVDENFINGGWTDFISSLDEENDARGWLLLEHLKEWKAWNQTEGNIFHDKIDMENIAVMGHSRGGEAAAIAAFFNKLPLYPDEAQQVFDYNFNIKSVVAIAPVDGQYRPSETRTPLENVNYLVLHGANDGDVQSFAGLRQYERLAFNDSLSYFKSAVYIYGANHGQFNTTWGNRDSGLPYGSLLNVDALMPMEEQLKIGQVYISAFLQTTLQGKSAYQALFKDYRTGKEWLPETIYLNQFEASHWNILADFEEDLDLKTTSSGGEISTKNLTVWKEKQVGMKWGDRGTRAVYIGWDSLAFENETAHFQIDFSEDLDANTNPYLTFELSEASGNTYPDKKRDEERQKKDSVSVNEGPNEQAEVGKEQEKEKEDEEERAEEPLDFTIELIDRNGQKVSFQLSEYSYLQRQVAVDVLKNTYLQSTGRSEAVYNTFFINLPLFTSNGDFDQSSIRSIKFVFDQAKKGLIILDKIATH